MNQVENLWVPGRSPATSLVVFQGSAQPVAETKSCGPGEQHLVKPRRRGTITHHLSYINYHKPQKIQLAGGVR